MFYFLFALISFCVCNSTKVMYKYKLPFISLINELSATYCITVGKVKSYLVKFFSYELEDYLEMPLEFFIYFSYILIG